MRLWLRSLPKLAACLSMLVLLLGCLSSAPPDVDDGSGQGGDATPGADWDTLLAQLPDASFERFGLYMEAVLDALRAVYAEDPHIVVYSEAPEQDGQGDDHRFTCVWRRFTEDDPQSVDPLDSAAVAQIQLRLRPAEGKAPSLADRVIGDEYMGWSCHDDVEATREAVMRMWQAILAGYSAEGTTFWGAFGALHEIEATGYLGGAGGEFLLPGPAGYDTSLVFQTWDEEDHCTAEIVLRHVPEGAFPSHPEDWGILRSAMPQPGIGPELEAYAEWMVTALRRVWVGQDVAVAQTGARNPTRRHRRPGLRP